MQIPNMVIIIIQIQNIFQILNMPRTSSAFFQRNYDSYLEKIQIKKNFINSTMLREKDLNALLFTLLVSTL